MLHLLIFRHAKSGWEADSDFERTLNERGEQQAMFMGELLKEKQIIPDLILCSAARRARQTLELAMKAGEWDADISILDELYNTEPGAVMYLLVQLPSEDKIVMLVGHEPTWSELATGLTNEHVSFNTAGISLIRFDVENWNEISPGGGILQWYEHP